MEKPISVFVNTFESEKVKLSEIYDIIKHNFDLTPVGIIDNLSLLDTCYLNTASYGHFGRENQGFLWEKSLVL